MTTPAGQQLPLLPRFDRSTLAELLPSIGAHLGVGRDLPALDLPASDRYVLVLVDGLGWDVLQQSLSAAPYFAELFGGASRLTSAVPSTTATSLTTLGTGLPPGRHGIVGYSFRDSADGQVFNALTWDTPQSPEELQPHPTWFERISDAGPCCCAVVPERFDGSGLTRTGLRGQVVSGIVDEDDEDDRIVRTVEASRSADRTLVYVYERMLDHTGHTLGVAHPAWRQQLTRIDSWVERLRTALDDDVVLLVTGDHGMLDIPEERRVIMEDEPELIADVDQVGGEGRLRQLYTTDPASVANRWRLAMGDRAWVRTRDEAISEGWFGPDIDPAVLPRIGDVLVAMRDDWAAMTRTKPGEMGLVGMHGSLTPVEMYVPLLVDPGAAQWPAGWGSSGWGARG